MKITLYRQNNELFGLYRGALLFSDNYENEKQVTKETNTDILNGQAVHRNEFGINSGIFLVTGER